MGTWKKIPDIASCQNGLIYSLRKTGKYRKCLIKNGLPFESIVPEPELSYMPYYSPCYKVYQDKSYLLRILPFSLSDIFGFVCLEVSKQMPVALKYKKGAPWREHPCTCVSINFFSILAHFPWKYNGENHIWCRKLEMIYFLIFAWFLLLDNNFQFPVKSGFSWSIAE